MRICVRATVDEALRGGLGACGTSAGAQVAAWWRENRPKAIDLFDDEMAAVLDRLAEAPKTGLPYRTIRNRQIRRILMARTSYNVYFEIQEERALVRVVAVWHAARGHGPPL